MSIATFSLVFYLLLVEVYSQTYPRVSFMSQTLPDHSYVDITTVGDSDSAVQCITDLTTCCSMHQGSHRGDWYFPNGGRLPIPGSGDMQENRLAQRVELRRFNNANSPTGIYRCDISTNAVHDDTDISVRDTVYVGLYTSSGGDVTISGDVMYDSDQMTLTCISTGGPATIVTWTRDATTVNGGQTVLESATTATYTHNLTLTEVVPGSIYTCTVSNNKPSTATKSYTIPDTDPTQSTSDGTSTTDRQGGDGDGGGGGGGGGEAKCEEPGVGDGGIALISVPVVMLVVIVVMGVVIFILLWKLRRSEETVNTGRLELLKVSGEKELQISSNEAYNVVGLSGRPTESEYDTVQPSSSSSTTHPPPPATSTHPPSLPPGAGGEYECI